MQKRMAEGWISDNMGIFSTYKGLYFNEIFCLNQSR